MKIAFTVHSRPQPQGSIRAFMAKGCKFPSLTSDNSKLKPYREQVALVALVERQSQNWTLASRRTPLVITALFFFARPRSIPKRERFHTRKPDLDKLLRATKDALKGILYEDDSQICETGRVAKFYGLPERVEIILETIE